MGGAAVLVLLALCGIGAAAVLIERTEQAAPDPSPGTTAPGAEPAGGDLDSRDTDRQPLTAKEVFPGKTLVVTAGEPAYEVLKTHSSGSCAVAATGELGDLLARLGCSQVVRATVRTADRRHLATVGLFNLPDRGTAQQVQGRIRELLDERQGRFRGMAAGDGTEAVSTAAARVGWQVRGHYVAYCLVVRADGEPLPTNDTTARDILYDMLELHLDQSVLQRRTTGGYAGQPTTREGADRHGGEDPPQD
ncbi:hypothetical protein [Micromonospora sp. KC721]|uniref:hypothetical protein n=1 Tax=Micromonospora sp. KC721 TaxID=2530380 RepID=UPI001A9E7CAC|nr:hypothetical protein [Micromonospora sp. KC721]